MAKLGPSPGKRLKMTDLARIAGVATSTISRALADSPTIPAATKEEIRRLAAEHGYVINQSARRLRQNKTLTVGVVIPLGHEAGQLISDPFFLQLFGRLADQISLRNYDVLLTRVAAPSPGWLSEQIQSQRADGYIVIGQSDQHEVINQVARSFLPLVVWGAHLPQQAYCSIGSDNIGGGRAAVDHLLQRGRRRIVFLGAANLPEVAMRLNGYKGALQRAGVSIDERLIVPAHFTGEFAYAAVQELLSRGVKFDAIFAASDVIALSALKALQNSGLSCPQDVAVIGFDDLDIAEHSHPPLTTVRQDLRRGASTLVEFLFNRMAGEETPSATLPTELIVRESTGPL